jgi:5'(3')-deoxyribonucleotidase
MSGEKPILATDIDDVLSASAEGFIRFSNLRWGTALTVEDYTEDWAAMWGINSDEVTRRATEIYAKDVFSKYAYIAESLPVLTRLQEAFDIIAITSRRRESLQSTNTWLEKYQPGILRSVHFAGIYDKESKTAAEQVAMTKADVLRELRPEILIDDQIKHCLGALAVGVTPILFGDYPWNRVGDLPSEIIRCRSWGEVSEYLLA